MKLFTKEIEAQLLANSEAQAKSDGATMPTKPVCKIFNPYGAGTWLLSEMDADGYAFGLCDLGMGSPELGYVSRFELEDYRHAANSALALERDLYWTADKSLADYAKEARELGRIRA